MPIADWSVPMVLTTPYATLDLNGTLVGGGAYLLRPDGCKLGQGVRSTKDDVPQADGSILHHRFLTGTEMLLPIQIWVDKGDSLPACDTLLQTLLDDLLGAMRSLLNAGDNAGRLSWTPAGQNARMLDDIRLLNYPAETIVDTSAGLEITVLIDSEYPYTQDLQETRTGIANGATTVITNAGTAAYFPVFQANRLNSVTSGSPCLSFTLQNLTTGIDFVYDSTLPGAIAIAGGSYGEIDTFRNSIFRNGNLTNLKAGVDELNSDYFLLEPGANSIKIVGCDIDVLWQNAWA